MKTLTVSLLILFTISAVGQSKKEYLDENCIQLPGPEGAVYYRIVEKKQGTELYLVRDYFASNDQLEMEATFSKLKPIEIREGKQRSYFENGQLKEEGDYQKGMRIGLWKSYHENGQLAEEVLHGKDKKRYLQVLDKSGASLLVNGTGRYSTKPYKMPEQHCEILDSVMIAAYFIDEVSGDSIYDVAQEQAEYKGGLERLYQEIRSDLKYPKLARRTGVEGKVFIMFVVDKAGTLRDLKVLKGIGAGCDEVASEALRTKNNWIPAKVRGKAVTQRMVLPIAFKLG